MQKNYRNCYKSLEIKCVNCDGLFTSDNDLKEHLCNRHTEKMDVDEINLIQSQKQIECDECNSNFASKNELRRHKCENHNEMSKQQLQKNQDFQKASDQQPPDQMFQLILMIKELTKSWRLIYNLTLCCLYGI